MFIVIGYIGRLKKNSHKRLLVIDEEVKKRTKNLIDTDWKQKKM